MFRNLSDKDKAVFRQWARDNYVPGTGEINACWHPLIELECLTMDWELADAEHQTDVNKRADAWHEMIKHPAYLPTLTKVS